MGNKILTFRDIEIEKKNFTAIDIEKLLVSNKISSGEKKL